MDDPAFSILTPLRNGVQYLPEAVASVRAQTCGDWEHIIGVNGFPVGSDVHRAASACCDRVYVFGDCGNQGDALTRLAGLARGEFVAVLDVDDTWEPTKLEKQLTVLRDGWDVVGTLANYFGNCTEKVGVLPGPVTLDDLRLRNCFAHSSVTMRRDIARWPNTPYCVDYSLFLRLASEGRAMMNLNEQLTWIRTHDQQHAAGKNDDAAMELRRRYSA